MSCGYLKERCQKGAFGKCAQTVALLCAAACEPLRGSLRRCSQLRFVRRLLGRIEEFVGDMMGHMRASVFCLAPSGHGWGNRIVHAMVTGCIPVIIQVRAYRNPIHTRAPDALLTTNTSRTAL